VLAPLAVEAVKRIGAIFDIEREINGRSIDERLSVRRERVASLVSDLEAWMRAHRAKLSRHNDAGQAMDYMLKRWVTFTRFLEDGRICLTNNAAGRALSERHDADGGRLIWSLTLAAMTGCWLGWK
jgi:transposase